MKKWSTPILAAGLAATMMCGLARVNRLVATLDRFHVPEKERQTC